MCGVSGPDEPFILKADVGFFLRPQSSVTVQSEGCVRRNMR